MEQSSLGVKGHSIIARVKGHSIIARVKGHSIIARVKGHSIIARVKEGAQGINAKKMWLQD